MCENDREGDVEKEGVREREMESGSAVRFIECRVGVIGGSRQGGRLSGCVVAGVGWELGSVTGVVLWERTGDEGAVGVLAGSGG